MKADWGRKLEAWIFELLDTDGGKRIKQAVSHVALHHEKKTNGEWVWYI